MRIAVDLTPLLPGGYNGGAKIVTIELIKNMSKLSPNDHFILLCTSKNSQEVSKLVCQNVSILNVRPAKKKISMSNGQQSLSNNKFNLNINMRLAFKKILPVKLKIYVKNLITRIKNKFKVLSDIEKQINADILFCPFTDPSFRYIGVPSVSVVHDLQVVYYPFFFSQEEQAERVLTLKNTCKYSSKIVCVSNYVKDTLIDNFKYHDKNIHVVYHGLQNRLIQSENDTVFEKNNIIKNQYLLYPANFWSHKNHLILFTAFNMFCKQYPHITLKLVCTGVGDLRAFYEDAVNKMGLSNHIIFLGFVDDKIFASVLQYCKAVIFPSLYEGFGMPLIEAMAVNKPVLCSNTTALPEIAGDAAIQFDPRKPHEIVKSIEKLYDDTFDEKSYIERGQVRIKEIGDEIEMASKYLNILKNVSEQTVCV